MEQHGLFRQVTCILQEQMGLQIRFSLILFIIVYIHLNISSIIRWFIAEIIDGLVKPKKLVITGDLVDNFSGFSFSPSASYLCCRLKTAQSRVDWSNYLSSIKQTADQNCEKILDIRGNHDGMIPTSFTDNISCS